jgi:serine/threonine protein kinase/tetratricopeptide (TPR) repeat protein
MSDELHDERMADLFARAKGLSAEDQARFLDEECRNDPADVQQRVEKLLAADRRLHPTADFQLPHPTFESPESRMIGSFKLLQLIGEGGMGEVWMAEQQHPVRRRVALKLIRSDSPTKEIIARFEAERQALAMMDHPNIAKVLDVGQTENGQPYFVMDLVQGISITDYCDRNKLTPRERLELFVPVCQAIQHAHQKGIIHRDIKPSNVLVTLYDGKPVAKVIDFGLAKALQTQTRLTDKTLFTEFGRVVGTLRYMSPEQAEMNALDVDTRTDVYSLGVMLYELLTGSTPLDQETIKEKAFLAVLQIIREQEPPRPSKRLSDSGEAISGISEQRRINPVQLSRLLKGDLDWIVMKALEKDRTRRYETAASLADDVQRYLENEPVEACPPSSGYRLRKLIKKYRVTVATVLLIIFLLVGGIIGTSIGTLRARRAESEAKEQRNKAQAAATASRQSMEAAQAREAETKAVLDFVEDKIFAAARPEGHDGGLGWEVTLREAVETALPLVDETFANHPLIEGRLRMSLGSSFLFLGDAALAARQLEMARAIYAKHRGPEDADTLRAINLLAQSYCYLARYPEAVRLYEEVLSVQSAKLGIDHVDTLDTMHGLANSYLRSGRHTEELKLRQEHLALCTAKLGGEHQKTIASMTMLGNTYIRLGRYVEALQLHKVALRLSIAKLGPNHPTTLACRDSLARSHTYVGQYEEAFRLHEENLELNKAKLGPDHPHTITSMINLTGTYLDLGRSAEAKKLADETLALAKVKLGSKHPSTLVGVENLADAYFNLGRRAEALELREQVLSLRKEQLGAHHPKSVDSMGKLADSYADAGRHAEARVLREQTLELYKGTLGRNHPLSLFAMMRVADSYNDIGRHVEAVQLHKVTLNLFKAEIGHDHPHTLECMHNLACGHAALGRHADALMLREETLALRKVKLGPDHPDTLKTMLSLADSLVRLKRGEEAVAVIDECVNRAASTRVDASLTLAALELRLRHFQNTHDGAGCSATAEKWETLGRTDPDSLFTAARMRAVTAKVIRDTMPSAGEDPIRHANLAMEWLTKAVAAGYNDVSVIQNDADLDVIRTRDDFKKLHSAAAKTNGQIMHHEQELADELAEYDRLKAEHAQPPKQP